MPTIRIRGGRILDPANQRDEAGDVWIAGGRVVQALPRADQEIDARGMWVTPGLIDIHVHFREPGKEEAETMATGGAAALAGGFTTVAVMPNTSPPIDTPAAVRDASTRARGAGPNVLVIAAITRGQEGRRLADLDALADAGAAGFSDDGRGVDDLALACRAFDAAAQADRPIISHCEVRALAGDGVINDGAVSRDLGLPGMPGEAEEIMVARDALLARRFRARLHVAHVSTALSADLIRVMKRHRAPVTAEVAPHHLLLTEESLRRGHADFKMNPPLRTQDDADALVEALRDGTIDAIASDHAPHAAAEKERGLVLAPCGVIGLESTVPAILAQLVQPGRLPLMQMIQAMTIGPARVLNVPKGSLTPGSDADVTIIDPATRWRIDASRFRSKSRNCPFDGWEVQGRAVMTIVRGEIRFDARR